MRRFALIVLLLVSAHAARAEFTTLKGHGGPVMGIAVSRRDGQVATASFDNSVGLVAGARADLA